MDSYIRKFTKSTIFWQSLTNTIKDFKPQGGELLSKVPEGTNLVCFHGNPRIFEAVHSIGWVKSYAEADFQAVKARKKVSVIIPYKEDRGWLKEAIQSVPEGVQLLISQGDGNWPENFNKVLDQCTGDYIKWLHEDDMLTENCIEDSVKAIEEQDVDFIHGDAIETFINTGRATKRYIPTIKKPTVNDLLRRNVIHSCTLMYRREVFEKIGRLDETLNNQEEYEFNLRCLKGGMKIGYCNKPLAFYRRHSLQKIRTVPIGERKSEKQMVKERFI